jgi:exopolyphosphatase/guanosine-5'-triphosphate,3'-diphosphate pyrophosphatase
MNDKKAAAIDIGSNAVRMLISRIRETPEGYSVKKEILLQIPLRLGEDTFINGAISEERIAQLIYVMKTFYYLMQLHQVGQYRAFATSALRESSNGPDIIKRVQEQTSIRITLLDQNKEAWIIYECHATSHFQTDKNYLYVDIGGGTTTIITIEKGRLAESQLFDIGTLKILLGRENKSVMTELSTYLISIKNKYNPTAIIGSGGNINKLARLIKTTRKKALTLRSLQILYNKLRQMTNEERMSQYDLDADQSDIIVPACDLLIKIGRSANISRIIVPTVGLVDGIIQLIAHKMIENNLNKEKGVSIEQDITYKSFPIEDFEAFEQDWEFGDSSDDNDNDND